MPDGTSCCGALWQRSFEGLTSKFGGNLTALRYLLMDGWDLVVKWNIRLLLALVLLFSSGVRPFLGGVVLLTVKVSLAFFTRSENSEDHPPAVCGPIPAHGRSRCVHDRQVDLRTLRRQTW